MLDASKISLQVQLYRQRPSYTLYERSSILSSSVYCHASVLSVKILIYGIFELRHVISNNVAFDKCILIRACAASF